jgi:alkanesulfonate monooxygenase SsuD/methylene tetrahydromethanopterin reductase-like flavin-dependent oxidoreductase (luciferase family)
MRHYFLGSYHALRPGTWRILFAGLHETHAAIDEAGRFMTNTSQRKTTTGSEMRLGFFTMPMHPPGRNWVETLKEDRQAFILADRLGFYDAFCGEHIADSLENVTNSFQFLASLIHETRTIKLATGTANLSQTHPVLIAAHAAMFDHLSEGRFILGVSAGALPADAELLGTLGDDRPRIFHEALDAILALWTTEPPYNFDRPDNRFKISSAKMGKREFGLGEVAKPFQKPYPEIVGTVVAPNSTSATYFGEKKVHPLSANFLLPRWVRTHWDAYEKGAASAGIKTNTADWRVARTVFVADDDKTAKRYARDDPRSPYRFYYFNMMRKFAYAKRMYVFKEHEKQPDSEITEDFVLDRLVTHGSVNKVVDELLKFHEETGPFGELVYAGMDWVDPALTKRSMELMATQVMPRVNAALASSADRKQAAV